MVAGKTLVNQLFQSFGKESVGKLKLLTLKPSANKWIWNLAR